MMHGHGDALLLRPLVGTCVVLVDERRRTTEARSLAHAGRRGLHAGRCESESADHVELAVDDRSVQFFFGFGKWRRSRPAHPARGRILRAHDLSGGNRDDTRGDNYREDTSHNHASLVVSGWWLVFLRHHEPPTTNYQPKMKSGASECMPY